jgi:hypothetical protein
MESSRGDGAEMEPNAWRTTVGDEERYEKEVPRQYVNHSDELMHFAWKDVLPIKLQLLRPLIRSRIDGIIPWSMVDEMEPPAAVQDRKRHGHANT